MKARLFQRSTKYQVKVELSIDFFPLHYNKRMGLIQSTLFQVAVYAETGQWYYAQLNLLGKRSTDLIVCFSNLNSFVCNLITRGLSS